MSLKQQSSRCCRKTSNSDNACLRAFRSEAANTQSSIDQGENFKGLITDAGASSKMAWAFTPPKPNESMAARRGSFNLLNQLLLAVLTYKGVLSIPNSGFTLSHSVGGNIL